MAERRMFCKTIIDGDDFLDLAPSARLLYYDLGMRADDDGFINAPKRIIRSIGASAEDLNALVDAGFLLRFPSGVVAIRHWKLHNQIRKDQYRQTLFLQEKEQLEETSTGIYQLPEDTPLQEMESPVQEIGKPVQEMESPVQEIEKPVQEIGKPVTQYSIGKDSIVQDREGQQSLGEESVSLHMRPSGGHTPSDPPGGEVELVEETGGGQGGFVPPTYREVAGYCLMNRMRINPQKFYDHYTAVGWKIGQSPMVDWQAALRKWASNGREPDTQQSTKEKFQEVIRLHQQQEGGIHDL